MSFYENTNYGAWIISGSINSKNCYSVIVRVLLFFHSPNSTCKIIDIVLRDFKINVDTNITSNLQQNNVQI